MAQAAVIFGGPSPEHDVSVLTGLQVTRELSGSRGDLLALYWSRAGDWYSVAPDLEAKDFANGIPKGAKSLQLTASPGGGFTTGRGGVLGKDKPLSVEVAVICCHGGPGEDGSLQGALDLAGIRYTGPSASGAAMSMDKLAFGSLAVASGVPSLQRADVATFRDPTFRKPSFDGPYIVKPRYGGSSIGIEIVEDIDTAIALLDSSVHLRRGAVMEPYRPELFDLNVAVRNYPQFELSAIERPVRSEASSPILGYADKYVGSEGMVSAPRELPASVAPALAEAIRGAARQLAMDLPVRGIARIDFLSDGKELFINEINPIPGSLSKHLWVTPHVSFSTLLDDLIGEALQRPSTHFHTTGADGMALRSAGSISSKLG